MSETKVYMQEFSVLLLDNNERFLRSAEKFLQEQEFITAVYSTPNDTEARLIAREKKPNVILLDVLMPGQNGIDLIPTLRSESPSSKIIMLTLWDMTGYRRSLSGIQENVTVDHTLFELPDDYGYFSIGGGGKTQI